MNKLLTTTGALATRGRTLKARVATLRADVKALNAKVTASQPTDAYMVLVEGECDQICGTKREADKEARDLRSMGHGRVVVRHFATWREAEAHEDKLRGY